MKGTFRVLGATCFKDTIDGQLHDFTKVKLEMSLPRNDQNKMGNDSTDWLKVGDASVLHKWRAQGVTLPATAEVDYELVLKKGDTTLEIYDIVIAPSKGK